MPWTAIDYPTSLNQLTSPVRDKAIEIANALMREGYGEPRALRIATAQAEDWARRRQIAVWADRPLHVNPHVVPHGERWAIRVEGGEHTGVFETRYEAVERAKEMALRQEGDVVVHALDGQIHDVLTPN